MNEKPNCTRLYARHTECNKVFQSFIPQRNENSHNQFLIDFDKIKAKIRNRKDFILIYFTSENKQCQCHYYFTKFTSCLISSLACNFN